jgi:hypothetical protein
MQSLITQRVIRLSAILPRVVAPKNFYLQKMGLMLLQARKKIDKKLFSSAPLMNMGYDKAILLTFLQLLKNEIFLRPSYFL